MRIVRGGYFEKVKSRALYGEKNVVGRLVYL